MHAEQTADQVLDDVIATSARLHRSIAHFDETTGHYALGGVPGVAFFHRDHPERITHESSSPSPAVAGLLDDLVRRHLAQSNLPDATVNSHAHALLLLVLTMHTPDARDRFGLERLGRRDAQIIALDEEDGRHDPELEVGDSALRAWVPLQSEAHPEAGAQPTILEFRFRDRRYTHYAPPT